MDVTILLKLCFDSWGSCIQNADSRAQKWAIFLLHNIHHLIQNFPAVKLIYLTTKDTKEKEGKYVHYFLVRFLLA
jgi:hypothetical protein